MVRFIFLNIPSGSCVESDSERGQRRKWGEQLSDICISLFSHIGPSVRGWIVSLQFTWEVRGPSTPVPQNGTVFGGRALKEAVQVK